MGMEKKLEDSIGQLKEVKCAQTIFLGIVSIYSSLMYIFLISIVANVRYVVDSYLKVHISFEIFAVMKSGLQ